MIILNPITIYTWLCNKEATIYDESFKEKSFTKTVKVLL